MGLKVVDGVVYVSEKQRLTRLVDTNGDEVADQYQTVATWPYGGNFHEFAFGLLYEDGYFYLNLSVADQLRRRDHRPAAGRRTAAPPSRSTRSTGQVDVRRRRPAHPARHRLGPGDGIFVTDNQGGWLPASKLVHIKQDRFFNHYTNPAGPFDTAPVTAAGAVDAAERDRQLAEHPGAAAQRPSTPASCSSATSPTAACSAPTWRRSTASTRARCSGSPRAWRPASPRSTSAPTARSTSAASARAATGARPAS